MHSCSICAKSFPSPYKLQRHHRIHTGQKPFTCTICGNAFNQPEHLRSHAQRVHSSNPSTDNLNDSLQQYLPSGAELGRSKYSNEKTQEKYRYEGVAATAVSSVASFSPGQMREMSPRDTCSLGPEMKDHAEPRLHVTNAELKLESVLRDNVESSSTYNPVSYAHNGFTCKVCLKSFSSELQLQTHVPVHDKSFHCRAGGETFSEKDNSNRQSKSLDPCGKITLRHQCPTCLKTFCSPSKLKRHFLIHTGQKPFSCTLCGKAFRQETHLKSHLSVAHKELFHQIEPKQMCDRNETLTDCLTADLGSQSSILQHHSSQDNPGNSSVELELQCKISLSAPQHLGISKIKSEPTTEPQPNDVCREALNVPVACEQGYLTNKELKPFRCATCSRSFRLELNLFRHQILHKSLKCQSEKMSSESRNPVDNSNPDTSAHVNICMNSEPRISSPEANYASPVDLNIIVKPETWSENITNDEDLKETMSVPADQNIRRDESNPPHQTIQNRLHQCYACSKSFPSLSKLQRHMLTHTGQKPFDCQTCGKSFRQKTHLRVHYRTHLWSRYHKQRSLYISRPPSRLPGCSTRPSADVTDVLIQHNNFKNINASHKSVSDIDLLSGNQLSQTSTLLSLSSVINRERHVLPSSKKNGALPSSTVTKMTVKDRQIEHLQSKNQIRHKCLQCFKCFPSPSKLRRHEMVHTGLKPFQCLVCGKMFRQAVHLKCHERTHFNWRHPKTVQRQGTTNTKERSQPLPYPRIRVHLPSQKKYLKPLRSGYAQHNLGIRGECEQNPPKTEESITKCQNVTTRLKHKRSCDERKSHTCRLCRKNFVSPYKLSRHLLTHYGIKPYKCSLCDKTFRQLVHLKVHERSRVHKMAMPAGHIQEKVTGTNHPQDEYLDNVHAPEAVITAQLIGYEGETVAEHPQSWYASSGHYVINDDLSPVSEGLAVPSADFLELNMEADCEQRAEHNQTMPFDQSSFASELSSEIQRLVQNQELAGLASSKPEIRDDIHCSLGTGFQAAGIQANPDSHKVVIQGHGNDVPDDYWCKPLGMFPCDKCSESFETEQDVQHHKCKAESHNRMAQPVPKYSCEVCLKTFGSPWKLERHYVIHTGQRPFKCNICGKTFTQTAHLRSHQRTHSL